MILCDYSLTNAKSLILLSVTAELIPDSRSYVSNREEYLAKIFPSIQKVLEKGWAAAS